MNQSKPDDRISMLLATMHSKVTDKHEQSRARLLDDLSEPIPTSVPTARAATEPQRAWRYAMGLSAIASAILLATWLFGPASPAVAMERMAQALDQVTAYSYRVESVFVSQEGQGRTVRDTNVGRLRIEPVGLHATMHIVESLGTNTEAPGELKTLVDLEETHQAGQRGIIIDHLKKEYWWIDEQLDAASIGNPQVAIYMVRQRRGRVLRDLGQRKIDGRAARGLEIILDADGHASDLGPASIDAGDWQNATVEVWVDPNTDLPIEFRRNRSGDDFQTTIRFTDLKWNVEFTADVFDTILPEGYTELEGRQ